jgi:hypothetical protein
MSQREAIIALCEKINEGYEQELSACDDVQMQRLIDLGSYASKIIELLKVRKSTAPDNYPSSELATRLAWTSSGSLWLDTAAVAYAVKRGKDEVAELIFEQMRNAPEIFTVDTFIMGETVLDTDL